MLIVGGGPAGAAAAIYAARKGIRTGVVAERFGGQVLDTMGIENFISVPAHRRARSWPRRSKQHVRGLRRRRHEPADARPAWSRGEPGGLAEVRLASGATLKARDRHPVDRRALAADERAGRGRVSQPGVAYCPHCDGPLFKGKRVAVIGGGNSGVEAAIDLAGIVAHVTLIEFDTQLRADEVLQRKLRSLPNVDGHHRRRRPPRCSATATKVIGLSLQGPRDAATPRRRRARRRLRADRPAAEHRVAEGRGRR